MKAGSIDIINAYVGLVNLTTDNAYIGYRNIIDDPTDSRLRFVAEEDSTFGLAAKASVSSVQYSFNEIDWTELTTNDSVTLHAGQRVFLRGKITGNLSDLDYTKFSMTGKMKCLGNIMWLYDYENLSLTTISYTWAFFRLFDDCTSLTTAPELQATTLTIRCYSYMFNNCTNLSIAPALPATSLGQQCYRNMFFGCTSLTTAPELPATILTNYCYYYMFGNCSSLNYIECYATDISATNCTYGWTNNVAATGTFIKDGNMSSWTTDMNGIPDGWTVLSSNNLTFEATSNSSVYLSSKSTNLQIAQYSTDGTNWTNLPTSSSNAINLSTGDMIYIRGKLIGNNSSEDYSQFSISGAVKVKGKIGYWINYEAPDSQTISYEWACAFLFSECDITSAPTLSATTLSARCYNGMFRNCTKLIDVSNLTLPATTLKDFCYNEMFKSCTNLTGAPVISATTLAQYCCREMFNGCTSLTTSPILRATTLKDFCYRAMFLGCTSLSTVTCLATNISATNCTTSWLSNVSATGTFKKNSSMSSWTTGVDGIPSGWTVQNYSA